MKKGDFQKDGASLGIPAANAADTPMDRFEYTNDSFDTQQQRPLLLPRST